MRARSLLLFGGLALTAGALAVLACGGDFDASSKVNSVRIFGVRPDKPYAKPGDTVTLEALVADGRRDKPRALKVFWLPVVCVNPREDLYYLCFGAPAGAVEAGASLVAPFPDAGVVGGGTALSQIPSGIDLGPFLPQGNTFSFEMPLDAIQPRRGSPPYGVAIVFNVACAGQVRIAQRSGANPQQVPIQCTDENGVLLPPSDYVIGINRVYTYADRTNTNPVVEKITLDGVDVDPAKGLTVDHCVAEKRADCKAIKLDVRVSDASWEANPEPGVAADQHEQVWVDYYSDIGDLKDDARLLFDSKKGRVDDTAVEYRAPYAASTGTIWAVVHDNRAGAAFVVLPLHVK